jgi:hypothetical protein
LGRCLWLLLKFIETDAKNTVSVRTHKVKRLHCFYHIVDYLSDTRFQYLSTATKYFTHTKLMYNGINGKWTQQREKFQSIYFRNYGPLDKRMRQVSLFPIYFPLIPFLLKSPTQVW